MRSPIWIFDLRILSESTLIIFRANLPFVRIIFSKVA